MSHQWRLALVSLFLCKLLRVLPEIAAASGTRFWDEPNLCFTPDWYCRFIDTVTISSAAWSWLKRKLSGVISLMPVSEHRIQCFQGMQCLEEAVTRAQRKKRRQKCIPRIICPNDSGVRFSDPAKSERFCGGAIRSESFADLFSCRWYLLLFEVEKIR